MDCRRAAFDALVETYSGEEITKRQREVQAHYKATLRQSDEVESEGKHGPIHDWGKHPTGKGIISRKRSSDGKAWGSDFRSWMDGRREAFDVLVETYSGEEITKRQREVQAHYKATLRQSDEVESEGKHGPIHDWGADKNVSLRTTKGVE